MLKADVLVALSQEAYDKCPHNLKEGGVLIVDSDKLVTRGEPPAVSLLITKLTKGKTNSYITVNTVVLGVWVESIGGVSVAATSKAVVARSSMGLQEIN